MEQDAQQTLAFLATILWKFCQSAGFRALPVLGLLLLESSVSSKAVRSRASGGHCHPGPPSQPCPAHLFTSQRPVYFGRLPKPVLNRSGFPFLFLFGSAPLKKKNSVSFLPGPAGSAPKQHVGSPASGQGRGREAAGLRRRGALPSLSLRTHRDAGGRWALPGLGLLAPAPGPWAGWSPGERRRGPGTQESGDGAETTEEVAGRRALGARAGPRGRAPRGPPPGGPPHRVRTPRVPARGAAGREALALPQRPGSPQRAGREDRGDPPDVLHGRAPGGAGARRGRRGGPPAAGRERRREEAE